MADGDITLSQNPNVDTALVEKDGKLLRAVLQETPAGTLQLSDSPNVDTGYIIDDGGNKHKVHLVATPDGTLETEGGVNSGKGYITDGDGKKHRVSLVASLTGGSGPVVDPYAIGTEIYDDSNVKIGVVGCHFRDNTTDKKYAVVVLDDLVNLSGFIIDTTTASLYPGTTEGVVQFATGEMWIQQPCATTLNNAYLAKQASSAMHCPLINTCYANTYTIGGVVYHGLIPNVIEYLKCFENIESIPSLSYYHGDIILVSSSLMQTGYVFIDSGKSGIRYTTNISTEKGAFGIIEIEIE